MSITKTQPFTRQTGQYICRRNKYEDSQKESPWFSAFSPWFLTFSPWFPAFPAYPTFPPPFLAFPPWFPTFPPWFPAFPPRFPAIPPRFPTFLPWFLVFPPFPSFHSPILHSGFYRQPFQAGVIALCSKFWTTKLTKYINNKLDCYPHVLLSHCLFKYGKNEIEIKMSISDSLFL